MKVRQAQSNVDSGANFWKAENPQKTLIKLAGKENVVMHTELQLASRHSNASHRVWPHICICRILNYC
jgi:hypothetical protein